MIKTQEIKDLEVRHNGFNFHFNDGYSITTTIKEAGVVLKTFGGKHIPVKANYNEKMDNNRFILTKIKRIAKYAGYTSNVDIVSKWSGYNDYGFYYKEINGYLSKGDE
jgi:hypothetical protein